MQAEPLKSTPIKSAVAYAKSPVSFPQTALHSIPIMPSYPDRLALLAINLARVDEYATALLAGLGGAPSVIAHINGDGDP